MKRFSQIFQYSSSEFLDILLHTYVTLFTHSERILLWKQLIFSYNTNSGKFPKFSHLLKCTHMCTRTLGRTFQRKYQFFCQLNAWISDRDRNISISLNSSKSIFVWRYSLINICYLITLAQTFLFRKNTNNLLKNTDFLVYCKSREFIRKSLIFHANFRMLIWKIQN